MLTASSILYTSYDEIPLRKLRLILQLLPVIRWEVYGNGANTYLKNLVLKHLFRSRKIYLKTTPEQRVDLFTHELHWLREQSTTFPIRTYSLAGMLFHAPDALMASITVERLMEADIALYRYLKSERSHYLHHFIAQLYLPATPAPVDTALFAKLPDHEVIAIIRAYLGCFDALRKRCKMIFPDEDTPDPKSAPKPAKAKDPALSWQTLLFELANTPGFPGMQSAKSALAWEALPYMDHEQQKIQAQNERLKK